METQFAHPSPECLGVETLGRTKRAGRPRLTAKEKAHGQAVG
jgi:hypothetical protein